MTDGPPTTADQALHSARTAPYGSWRSPITARLIAESGIGAGAGCSAAADSLFWVEMRPLEDGRYVVVRRGARRRDRRRHARAAANSRTLVQEYGGGMYAVHAAAAAASMVVYSEFADQRLYRVDVAADGSASEPRADHSRRRRPPPRPAVRGRARHARRPHADLRARAARERRRRQRARRAPHRRLGALRGSIAGGHDFYAAPRLSPDGRRLAWLCWDHPQMPWDGTELWVADLTAAGGLAAERRVAGGPSESVLQPDWSPSGRLHFVSDRSGWWNLYRLDEGPAQAAGTTDAVAAAAGEGRRRRSPRCRPSSPSRPGSSACRTTASCRTGASSPTTAATAPTASG